MLNYGKSDSLEERQEKQKRVDEVANQIQKQLTSEVLPKERGHRFKDKTSAVKIANIGGYNNCVAHIKRKIRAFCQ